MSSTEPILSTHDLWQSHPNPFLCIAGRDQPAHELLAQALAKGTLPVRAATESRSASPPHVDYAQIDPTLPVDLDAAAISSPPVGAGYAGLTAAQRGFFYAWLHHPYDPAPPTYQRLYLAQLETRLFAGEEIAAAVRADLLALLNEADWAGNPDLTHTALLAGWLAQDGAYLSRVLAYGHATQSLLGIGLGWQAMAEAPFCAAEVLVAGRTWRRTQAAPPLEPDRGDLDKGDLDIVQLKIDSLAATLGADPLRWALAQIMAAQPADAIGASGEEADRLLDRWRGDWLPWRCVHRDLHVALPQPDLRPFLAPLLAELRQPAASQPAPSVVVQDEPDVDSDSKGSPDWVLVLEFGASQSQFYEYVVLQAQKQPNYLMLMDETRQLVHRLIYRKRQMRQFWRLWDYVQNWTSTKVYLNGQELEPWKIWPYSQYLR